MTAAGRIRVRELVDQDDLGVARGDRVQVHLLETWPRYSRRCFVNDLEALEQRFGLGAPVRLDDPDDDVALLRASRSRAASSMA